MERIIRFLLEIIKFDGSEDEDTDYNDMYDIESDLLN